MATDGKWRRIVSDDEAFARRAPCHVIHGGQRSPALSLAWNWRTVRKDTQGISASSTAASCPHVEAAKGREAKDLDRELGDSFKSTGFSDAESKALIATVRAWDYRFSAHASDIVVDS